MQKRGQVYLLAALIIGFILFILATQANIVKKTIIEDDFEALSENYERESTKFVNTLLQQGSTNLADDFLKFTVLFSSFAKTKNPEFGLIYAFVHEGNLYLGNYLDTSLEILSYSPSLILPGCYQDISTTVTVGGTKLSVSGINIGTFSHCILPPMPPPANKKLRMVIEGIEYKVELAESNPEIIIVSRETKERQKKVFVKGNFIKGKAP